MKAGKEHRVALAPQAVALLRDLQRESDGNDGFVFIGARPGSGLSDMAMTAVRQTARPRRRYRARLPTPSAIGLPGARTILGEIAEMALAHKVSDKVEAAYRRGDLLEKRKRLAADWARYCFSPVAKTAKTGGEVTPIRGGS